MSKYILDVSQWQGKVDWSKTKDVVDFIVLRASCGMKLDKRYKINSLALDEYGVPYHAYHYIKAATKEEARAEAGTFVQATKGSNPLFYVIDVEYAELPKGKEKEIVEEFEEEMYRQLGRNIRIAAYIAHHKYASYKLDRSRYAYIWIPRYGKNTGKPDKEPKYPCDLWQYTSVGRVDGISGNVDMSQLHGDKPLEFFIHPEVQEENEEPTKEPVSQVVDEIVNEAIENTDSIGVIEMIKRIFRWIGNLFKRK